MKNIRTVTMHSNQSEGSAIQNSPSVAILTGISLSQNPRARKEAAALQSAGLDTHVFGAWVSADSEEEDNRLARKSGFSFHAVGSIKGQSSLPDWKSLKLRGRRWLSKKACNYFGKENKYQLGYFTPELYQQAKRSHCNFLIAHLEQSMWVANKLLTDGIAHVGVDMEDWYSENVMTNAQIDYPVSLLRRLEGNVLRRASHRSCPSYAMSAALANAYNCPPPAVIYNAFEWTDRTNIDHLSKDRHQFELPTIHWVSQTLGSDRGLDDLLGALPYVKKSFEIHLRGDTSESMRRWVYSQVPSHWIPRIHLHKPVSNEELLSRISEHDIGFAGERRFCRNKELTVSNKILHYLLGGLGVIASDTLGHCEVASQADGAVHIYRTGDAEALAHTIDSVLASPTMLPKAKALALVAAQKVFCWERQAPELVRSVARCIHSA